MRLELAQTFAVGSAHPTVILYLIMLDYLFNTQQNPPFPTRIQKQLQCLLQDIKQM